MDKKELYEAPATEIVAVKSERTFCLSDRSLGLSSSTGGDDNVEDRQSGGVWGNGDWN